MTLMGVCAAALFRESPLLLPALAIPAVLVHRAVQQSTELRENVREALASLVEIVELRDPYTAGHSRRVAELARAIAIELGLTAEEADAIEDAGKVHDLGKVAIDPAILLKPGKLTDAEWAEMKRHPVFGADVLARFASYRSGIPLVRGHHESWDGSGYPDGLRGTDIPLGARILAAADTFDALTSDRPYRSGMEISRARAILADGAGAQWDASIIESLFRVLDAQATSEFNSRTEQVPVEIRAA
jgi:HD-GYP domain-containing protein (c-di-GMP phosphodiesterase class II)